MLPIVTHPTPAALGHRRHQRLQQFQGRAQIDRDLTIEPLAVDRQKVFRQFDRGVQHQDIDAAQRRRDLGGEARAGVVGGEIGAECPRLSAHRGNVGHHRGGVAGFLLVADVMDRERRALRRQAERDRPPDLPPRAGDESLAALERELG